MVDSQARSAARRVGAGRRRVAWLLALLAAGAVAGTSGTAPAAKKPPPKTAADKALFQYAACMRKKGVKIPDPARGKDGKYAFPAIPAKVTNAPGVKQKAQACAAQLPRTGRAQNVQTPAQRAASKKFTDCMAKNGVKLTQPSTRNPPKGQPPRTGQPPQGGQRQPGGGFFNSKDPKVKKALAKCRKYMPVRPGG